MANIQAETFDADYSVTYAVVVLPRRIVSDEQIEAFRTAYPAITQVETRYRHVTFLFKFKGNEGVWHLDHVYDGINYFFVGDGPFEIAREALVADDEFLAQEMDEDAPVDEALQDADQLKIGGLEYWVGVDSREYSFSQGRDELAAASAIIVEEVRGFNIKTKAAPKSRAKKAVEA